MSGNLEVLIAGVDPESRLILANSIVESGLGSTFCSTVAESQQILTRQQICMVFCDESLPDGGFRNVLAFVRRFASGSPFIVVSRVRDWAWDWERSLVAMTCGVFDHIAPSISPSEAEQIVKRALRELSLFV